jgi:hypothetical protein
MRKGTCHGILIWVDYGLQDNASDGVRTHSTRGRTYRQLVRMLPKPVVLEAASFSQLELVCRFELGSQPSLESYKLELGVEQCAGSISGRA